MASNRPRRRLLLGAFVALSVYLAMFGVAMLGTWGIGWDAHAYYVAWDGGLYEKLPESLDAYNYSPLFAQVVWPLTLLPWPVFCALFVGAAAAGVLWLSRPLSPVAAAALWLFCVPEVLSGNIFWLLAVTTVVGLSHSSAWSVAAFTKVVPCLGPVWFAARGEWRRLAVLVATCAGLLVTSYLVSPHEWASWVDFLRESAGDSSGNVYLTPVTLHLPLLLRLPVALVLAVVAARTSRRWLLPVAMLVACPVVGWGSFALLAAIPRLRQDAVMAGRATDAAHERTSPGRRTHSVTP